MDHVAILNPKFHYLDRILDGTKTIESRWYKTQRAPWHNVEVGDTIYFKNSGQPVTLRAQVSQVRQFSGFTYAGLRKIIQEYGQAITAGCVNLTSFYQSVKQSNYAILMTLVNPEAIESFVIDKTGYGIATAWICVDDIRKLYLHKELVPVK